MGVLTELTREKHKEVESSDFVQYMFSGNITKEHYLEYLIQMWHIYNTLEYYGKITGHFSEMNDLLRSGNIIKDIDELCKELNLFRDNILYDIYDSTNDYKQHIIRLYYTNKPMLLAHIYVRHMGDLYGGKVIAKRVPGSGWSYHFENRPAMIETLQSKMTEDLLEEAIKGFDFCGNIFKELTERQSNGKK
jgi:heme oxygenase